jgi:hypothetical protein
MTVFHKPATRLTKVVCCVLNDNTKLIYIVRCNKWSLFDLTNVAFNFQPLFRRAHRHWIGWAELNDKRDYMKRRSIFLRHNFTTIFYIKVGI